MSLDAILTVSGQALAFLIVAFGFVATLYPLATNRRKVACLCCFVLIGMAVGVISTIQSNRTSDAQATVQNQIAAARSENKAGFAELQARLDAVVGAVT